MLKYIIIFKIKNIKEKIPEERKVLEIPKQDFIDFLIRAKKEGYASGVEYEKDDMGRKHFRYQETIGNFIWCFHDSYIGNIFAPGTETISLRELNYRSEPNQLEKGIPIWFMNYGDHPKDGLKGTALIDERIAKETIKFLKESLLNPDKDIPIRGPLIFESVKNGFWWCYDLGLIYKNVACFEGNEFIHSYEAAKIGMSSFVFQQHISGGLIQHKNIEVKLV